MWPIDFRIKWRVTAGYGNWSRSNGYFSFHTQVKTWEQGLNDLPYLPYIVQWVKEGLIFSGFSTMYCEYS